jgi:hypothetical protein
MMWHAIDTEWQAEVRERAPGFAQAFADNMDAGQTELAAPSCPKGCGCCFRECAVRHIIADWWTRELAEVQSAERQGLAHNGVIYTVTGKAH